MTKRLNTLDKIDHFFRSEFPKIAGQSQRLPAQSYELSRRFLEKLGNPQDSHRVIHVAGTSGKGTVCYMIDAILRAHNKRTSLLVSPHVYDLRERVQINGQFMPERHFISVVNEVLQYYFNLPEEGRIGYYRLMVILSFLAASRTRSDYVIVESSGGGRYDATNTINRSDTAAVITQIGIDHTDKLGTTHDAIAAEEASIVKPNMPVVALRQRRSVNEKLQEIFNEQGCAVSWVDSTENYQTNDIMLAIETVKKVAVRDGWQFDDEKASLAIDSVYIPGRFEKRIFKDKLILMDGAHNPQKIRALSWRLNNEDLATCTVVLAISNKKDYFKMLEALKPITKRLICTQFFSANTEIPVRPIGTDELTTAATELGFQEVIAIKNPLDAMRKAAKFNEPIVATGSFYLLGELDHLF